MVCELRPEVGRRACPDGADADLVAEDGAEADGAHAADVIADINDGAGTSADLVVGHSATLFVSMSAGISASGTCSIVTSP